MAASLTVQKLLASRYGQSVKEPIRGIFRRLGYELSEAGSSKSPGHWVALNEVDAIVDVGANQGQFGRLIRASGWRGPIVSFEPGREAFSRLVKVVEGDDGWTAHRVALGATTGMLTLVVSQNSVSSSLLPPTSLHVETAPTVRTVATEQVPVARLDDVQIPGERLFLKLDVQGFEAQVLNGAQETLQRCALIQTELSFAETYEGGADWLEVLRSLRNADFRPIAVLPGLEDRDGRQLQIDMVLTRGTSHARRLT